MKSVFVRFVREDAGQDLIEYRPARRNHHRRRHRVDQADRTEGRDLLQRPELEAVVLWLSEGLTAHS